MNNPMLDGFIESMEDTFGKYRHGMLNAIKTKLYSVNQDGFDKLLRHIIEDYDMGRPPSLKVILGEIYKHGISLNHQQSYAVSVCEHCGQEYSQAEILCPKCQRLRKYGLTKLVRYKPKWIDFENEEEERFIKEWLDLKK